MIFKKLIVVLTLCVASLPVCGQDVVLPPDLDTVDDGRRSINELVSSYLGLLRDGWEIDVIASSQPRDADFALPIFALRTTLRGPAVWIISGIHGEEPAGPNAIAAVIDDIARLGERRPVVLIPLANPHGYLRNWRYLNVPLWSAEVEAQSVGDSSHLLPDALDPRQARAVAASSAEAGALTGYIVDRFPDYPPVISIDLHEDDKISEGYVYSQGSHGAADRLAREAIRVLRQNDIPVKMTGFTRFDEQIEAGIIGPVSDSSIDELMSARSLIVDGERVGGPGAETVLVFETPAGALPIDRRIAAHVALLQRMIELVPAGGL